VGGYLASKPSNCVSDTLSAQCWGGWRWLREGQQVASIRMRAEADRVILTYRHRSGEGEWKDEEYPVFLDHTPCRLGGSRPWFLCPARRCGRRVAILYGGTIFACRRCHHLAYDSSREDAGGRATRGSHSDEVGLAAGDSQRGSATRLPTRRRRCAT